MITKNSILILLCSLITLNFAFAQQSTALQPRWLTKMDTENYSIAYSCIVSEGSGSTLEQAKQHAFVNLTTRIEHERGIVVTSTLDATSKMRREAGGAAKYESSRDFTIQYKEKDKLIEVDARVLDEYWYAKGGVYYCYSLYAVAKAPFDSTVLSAVGVTNKYGARGVVRSLIIPGWGQFYKGSKLKGALMLSGTAALAGGIIATEGMRSNYIQKMGQTYNVDNLKFYSDKANQMANIRNLCIGGAAALYIYNLIDAAVAPGASRVKVKKLSVAPYTGNGAGVGMSYKF